MRRAVAERQRRAAALGGLVFAAVVVAAGCSKLPLPLRFDGPLVPADAGGEGAVGDGAGGDGGGVSFDWRDAVIYFVLVDRFHDGDPTNNAPVADVEAAANFHGGDLAGVLAKIEEGYFASLGVNVLWLSSPVDAPDGKYPGQDGHDYTGYHGYWPVVLNKVEQRLGDLALLQQVVARAHAQGLRVIVDYVMNHVHEESPVYGGHPDWFWPLAKDGTDCICGAGCSWEGDEGRRCWFDPFLPAFDFGKAEARQFSVDDAVRWIRDTGVDGLRLDAVKHIDPAWLTDLRARISAEVVEPGQRFYLVGETFTGDRDELAQLVDPQRKLDGQFDFPQRAQLARVILMRQGSFADLDVFLDENAGYYGPSALMSGFVGNHDLPRAVHLAEDAPQFGEWDTGKARAWDNRPTLPGGRAPFERLGVAFSALLTLPGVPMIYYGDELGAAGGGDPDNRRPMAWSGATAEQLWLRQRVTRLLALRRDHPALRRGVRTRIHITADVYAYRMEHEGEQLSVLLNRSDASQSVPLPGDGASSYRDLLNDETLVGSDVVVPARSARVLQRI